MDPAAAPAADGSMHGGYISVTHSDLGIASFASIGMSLVLITNTVLQRPGVSPGQASDLTTVESPSI